MSTNKIEIFENTLLKLLIRRGSDAERQNIILSEGELGYTTDTKRLFVGDSQTTGGVVAGNIFKGLSGDVTLITDAVYGDLAYDNDDFTLYVYTGASTWTPIGRLFNAGNDTIDITGNSITVGTISASNLSNDVAGNSIVLDGSNRISLNGTQISTNSVTTRTGSYLSLPGGLNINNVAYNWPGGGVGPELFLKTDITGTLTWSPASAPNTIYVGGSAGQLPVGTIMPFVSSANAPSGWLLCNGQSVAGAQYPYLSAVIGYTYGGAGANFNVPNLINKTLYGVNNNPAGSTVYSIASGSNSTLSAVGALYIIKAEPDNIINSTLEVFTPLSATLNGVEQTGAFNPLSGVIEIGLETTSLTADTTILGGFVADKYGRVLQEVGGVAGDTASQAPGTRSIYNLNTSPIGFFTEPAYIINAESNLTAQSFIISAYPFITGRTGAQVGGGSKYSVPPNAKNLIIETWGEKLGPDGGNVYRIVAAAPGKDLLDTSGTNSALGTSEFMLWFGRASGGGDHVAAANTTFLPMSATALGHLTAAFRLNQSTNDTLSMRVIGYTL